MSKEDKSLTQNVKKEIASNPGEHILNVLKAGLATAPFCGGIASLMTDYIPSAKQERLEKFAEQIASDLNELKGRVNEKIILSEDFAYTFEKCFRGVAENYQKERLEAFRGILINSALGTNMREEEKDYFMSLVSSLSLVHIRVLMFMANPKEYLEENNIPEHKISGGFNQFFQVAIPGIPLEIIKSAFGDLYQNGFLNNDKTIFGLTTSSQGLDLLGNGGRVTNLGFRFINFCKSPCK